MARDTRKSTETEKDALPVNLRALMEKAKISQKQLGEVLGTTPQAISLYAKGLSKPDWKTIVRIADYFHVSTDWLLGLSDVRNTDPTLKAVCEYTGLSESVVEKLHDRKSNQTVLDLVEIINLTAEKKEAAALCGAIANLRFLAILDPIMNAHLMEGIVSGFFYERGQLEDVKDQIESEKYDLGRFKAKMDYATHRDLYLFKVQKAAVSYAEAVFHMELEKNGLSWLEDDSIEIEGGMIVAPSKDEREEAHNGNDTED